MTKETFLLCKTVREGLFTVSVIFLGYFFFSFKILYVQFFKTTQCLTSNFHLAIFANHQKPNPVAIRQFLSSSGKKPSSLHLATLCLPKTPILSKRQTARAKLQRSYLYSEAGHCYCTHPTKHTQRTGSGPMP